MPTNLNTSAKGDTSGNRNIFNGVDGLARSKRRLAVSNTLIDNYVRFGDCWGVGLVKTNLKVVVALVVVAFLVFVRMGLEVVTQDLGIAQINIGLLLAEWSGWSWFGFG